MEVGRPAARVGPRPGGRLSGSLVFALLLLALPAAAAGGECRTPRPKTAFLNYFWHREIQFDCYLARPRWQRGAIDSADPAYYADRFRRLSAHGVDVLGLVFTGFDGEPDPEDGGRLLQTSFDGANLKAAIPQAQALGMPFFIYYDLKVRTAVKSRLCRVRNPRTTPCSNPDQQPVRNFNLKQNGGRLYEQLKEDFLRIKNDFILPHRDAYYMLEDETGEPILDEFGLPRPVVGIYIARNLDGAALSQLLREVTAAYRADGLGEPAFVLDLIWWYDRKKNVRSIKCTPQNRDGSAEDVVSSKILDKFGSAAVAATSFFPVGAQHGLDCGIVDMRGWTDEFARLYATAAVRLAADPALEEIQIWPGLSSQFDNGRRNLRRCDDRRQKADRISFPLDGTRDWRKLLDVGYASARVGPAAEQCDRQPGDREPLPQTLLIVYDNEFRETAVVDCVTGRTGAPDFDGYRFGCALLDVVEERDRALGWTTP